MQQNAHVQVKKQVHTAGHIRDSKATTAHIKKSKKVRKERPEKFLILLRAEVC